MYKTNKEFFDSICDLQTAKNANYGNSFEKLWSELGPISGLVPLHNKLDRLTNLIKNPDTNKFESIEDTLKDLCGYAWLFYEQYSKSQQKEAESKSTENWYTFQAGEPIKQTTNSEETPSEKTEEKENEKEVVEGEIVDD